MKRKAEARGPACCWQMRACCDTGTRNRAIRRAVSALRHEDFDSILVSGTSGLVFGGILAHRLRKNLVVVRKRDDITHSIYDVESGTPTPRRAVFVDDVVESGTTLAHVLAKAREWLPALQVPYIYLYLSAEPDLADMGATARAEIPKMRNLSLETLRQTTPAS